MHGFQPKHARGKPAQALADGGLVHSITGMSAMQRREKELSLKDGGTVGGFKPGGLIRGPGTGTSDSIKTEKRPGTFIMPADSTQAIGPEALQSLGAPKGMPEAEGMEEPGDMDDRDEPDGEKVPVRLSNGEFELPPEQVQALGEAVLTVMRNATHQPAGEQGEAPTGKGFTPHQFFSGGGTVKDKEQQRLANQTAMYVRGAQEAAANRPPEPAVPRPPAPAADPQSGGQAAFGVFPQLGRNSAGAPEQTATPQAAAQVPATQVEGWRTKAVMDGAADDAQAAWDRGGAEGVAGAAGAVARGAITAVPTAMGEFAYNTVAPLASTAKGFWNGVTGGSENALGIAQAPLATPAVPRPSAPAAATTTAQQATMPAQQPGAQTPQPAMQAPNAGAGQVTRAGNSYSGTNVAGDITVNGQAPGGGAVSAQNMVAADALQARQTPAGFQPAGSPQASVQAPIVRNSTNDWAARKALANAETAASSITNTRRWGGKGAESSPDVQAYQAMLRNDLALQQAQPGMDKAAMDGNTALQREGIQQAGATGRTAMQEQGASARDAGRTAIARGELGLKQTAAGFQVRAAQQLEGLQNQYAAETDPAKQAALARQIREVQGKEQPARFKVASGGQQIDANGVPYRTPDRIFNEQTGVYSDGAGAAPAPQALPPGMKRQIGTSNGRPVYEDMNGKQVIAKG